MKNIPNEAPKAPAPPPVINNTPNTPVTTTVPAASKKMKNCKVCGAQIAKNAKTCPSCGAKNKKPIYQKPIFIVFVVVIALFVISSISSSLSKPENVKIAEKLVRQIGTVTIDSKAAIDAAEKAVGALTTEELESFSKQEDLDIAKKEFAKIEIEDLIDKIGTVSLDSKEAISAARKKYNDADEIIQTTVKNYATLEAAEKEFSSLNIANAIKLIDAIGTVSLKSGDKIDAAKDAYNSVLPSDKDKVTNKDKLTDAETKYKTLVKADKEKRAKSYLAKLNDEYDSIEGVTWYYPSTFPNYIDTRCYLLPYIGKDNNGYAWLRNRMNYTGDNWIFWKTATIVVDGKKYYKLPGSFGTERDNDNGYVWEYYDYDATNDVDMLKAIANSKETVVRFDGKYQYDLTIKASDKKAIKEVIDAYEILAEK